MYRQQNPVHCMESFPKTYRDRPPNNLYILCTVYRYIGNSHRQLHKQGYTDLAGHAHTHILTDTALNTILNNKNKIRKSAPPMQSKEVQVTSKM